MSPDEDIALFRASEQQTVITYEVAKTLFLAGKISRNDFLVAKDETLGRLNSLLRDALKLEAQLKHNADSDSSDAWKY